MSPKTVSAVINRTTFRVVGPVNTPQEASDKAAIDAETAPLEAFVGQLMRRDGTKGIDGSPESGKVSTTLPLVLPSKPRRGDKYEVTYGGCLQSFNNPSLWLTGKANAGRAGVVLDFNPATRTPTHLQIQDSEGKLSIDATFERGVLRSYDNVLATVGGGRIVESFRRGRDEVTLTITRER